MHILYFYDMSYVIILTYGNQIYDLICIFMDCERKLDYLAFVLMLSLMFMLPIICFIIESMSMSKDIWGKFWDIGGKLDDIGGKLEEIWGSCGKCEGMREKPWFIDGKFGLTFIVGKLLNFGCIEGKF